MRGGTVARSYAGALFELATREGDVEGFGRGIDTVARLIDQNPRIREFVETPRLSSATKKDALEKTFRGHVPPLLLNFIKVVIDKRRQRLIREIAREYRDLGDKHAGRTHVDVTLARALDEAARTALVERLSRSLRTTVIPQFHVRPGILGGVVLRTGDMIYDGSLRRQIEGMRRTLLAAELPALAGE